MRHHCLTRNLKGRDFYFLMINIMVLLLKKVKDNLGISGLDKLFKGKSGRVGDIIMIQYENKLGYWKMRQFIGRCVGIRFGKNGIRYQLRNIINGTGVNFSFDASSHIFLSARVVSERRLVKFRQSKLYYLRSSKYNYTRLSKLT